MKTPQSFSAFIEFAKSADEGIVDLSDAYPPVVKGVPTDESKRSSLDWLALHLYYIFSDTGGRNHYFFMNVLEELNTIKTQEQLTRLVEIEEIYAAVELVGYEDQWTRLEIIKKALRNVKIAKYEPGRYIPIRYNYKKPRQN